ncbi:MAG: helix-turn-helix transcriptional regulator [Acidimicrobiales bacterium]
MEQPDPSKRPGAEPAWVMDFPTNLPLNLGPLLGRESALDRVGGLLAGRGLVTLTGPPGVGKTALALTAAASVGTNYPGGVWLVNLGRIDQAEFVLRSVSSALSTHERHGLSPYESLVARIANRATLLVLDNCEHVVAACAEVVSALLAACPALTVLATSQEPLGVAGEQTWPVRGLAVPDDVRSSPDQARSSPPVRLFGDRARARNPDFTITDDSLAAVVEICRRLDGIPLAIELAAARVVMFSPAEIARRLDDRFEFLTGGDRASHSRHETLRAAVDWSHELLSEAEQTLLRRLSVFAGSFTFGAAEGVCPGEGLPARQCLDLMTKLVTRSLVTTQQTRPGATRYCLLETIRHYYRDRLLESGEADRLRLRHAAWYTTWAERAEPELSGPGQEEWLWCLDEDHDNLRAALHQAVSSRDPADGQEMPLRLAGALTLFWRIRGHYGEGRGWLDQALSVSPDGSPALRAKATWGLALLAAMVGDYAAAAPAAETSLASWRELGDLQGIGRALLLVGTCGLYTQGVAASIPVLQQAVAMARQIGDRWCLAHALALCGASYNQLGDAPAARPMLEECLDVARAAADRQCLAFGLDALGHVAFCEGDYEAAEVLLQEALALARATGGAYEAAGALTDLAQVAAGRGDRARARAILGDALAIARGTNSTDTAVYALEVLGRLAEAEGDLGAAERLFGESLALAQAATGTSAASLQGLGRVALARGEADNAQPLLDQALALGRSNGNKAVTASSLHALGDLARVRHDDARAAGLYHEALALRAEIGDLPNAALSLEALSAIDAEGSREARAVRVLSAADRLRRTGGYARSSPATASHASQLDRLEQVLGASEFEAAWAEGAQMSLDDVVAYVSKGRGVRSGRPVVGWASLTPAERDVANLAGQGFTNAEIGERLFVSVNTVKKHMARVLAKLGVTHRRELTRRGPTETS